ncbi:alpha-hydroxy acid oxidase [Variovorax sp. Sphag1AA]|uniref:alpha-hydroxy acid oxidase n=1 Tax=Variovorax sp. Sphag1AA TaxID=2587027 RepID=UPI0016117030|nr:alpha-hydroxy acid oxidase [Variovorax sp. Sphag1AA]MBB3180933.1 L-lactate dehydrogenase (cytochrome)/(S)-mandelate dehydrogenase [Variovorax sp. Sphag1AA]
MTVRVEKCLSIRDLQQQARRYLPRVIYDYLEGGADDEACLSRNEDRIRAHTLRPRYLVDIGTRSQEVAVFGRTYASPFGIGPMGMLGMVRHGGDLMLAEVAHRNGLPFVLSGASNASTEAVAAKAPGSWLNYYPCKSDEIERDLLKRAADSGIETLVVTVDVPLHAKRERNMRSGWVRPYKPTPAVIAESLRHPAWVASYLRHGLPVMENIRPYAPRGTSARDLTSFYASQVPTRHQWGLVGRLREQWKGNLVLKGILAPEDAEAAAAAGVDGVIVSNHGGRQLDRSVAAIDALPEVVAAVGHRMVVMFDSGIRRGSDIAVALSLGARLCFVGRAAAYGLAGYGLAGAQRAIEILRGELDLTLGQIGCPRAAELGPNCLWERRASDAVPVRVPARRSAAELVS